ncbi:MAG: response regulator [Elusimicrobia bacterium]|nr:response regulator [Elusimicrobiota bacterium]
MVSNDIKVLIIDDDQQLLDTTTVILRLNGFLAYSANTGKQGLKKANEIKPDIVILDVWLPDVDGFHVYLQLKERPDTANIPVIFITGDETLDIEKGFSVGGDDCIVKPIDPEYLATRILKLVNKEKKIITPTQAPKKRVLIVDDDRQICDMLKNLLIRKDYEADILYEGINVLNVAKERKPDIILLDISFPSGPSGIEICGILKSNSETRDIPIIMMTANEDIQSVDKCFELGAEDYIFKPFSLEDLLLRIKKYQLARRT